MYKNKVKGTLQAIFIVEKDGSLSNFEIIRDLGYGTADEFLRILNKYASTHKWSPGYQDGHAVRVKYTIPIVISY